MCRHELRCPKTLRLLPKGHDMSSNNPAILVALQGQNTCPGGLGHEVHGEIIGGNAELSGRYTPSLVRLVLKAYRTSELPALPATQPEDPAAQPEDSEEIEDLPDPEAERQISKFEKLS